MLVDRANGDKENKMSGVILSRSYCYSSDLSDDNYSKGSVKNIVTKRRYKGCEEREKKRDRICRSYLDLNLTKWPRNKRSKIR